MFTEQDRELFENKEDFVNIKTYRYRWIIFVLFGLTLMFATSLQISLFNITDIMLDYYGITDSQMVLGSTVAGVVTIVLVLPAGFIPPKYGLRFTVVIGSSALAISASIFVVATYRDGYYAFLLSAVFGGITLAILPQLIPEVGAAWFPLHEQPLITNIGYSMQGIGMGIAYVETMLLFNNVEALSKEELYWRVRSYMYLQTLPCIIVFILIFVFFKDKPELPPTIAKLQQKEDGQMSFMEVIETFKKLVKNANFLILAVLFGFNYCVTFLLSLTTNSFLSRRYGNSEEKVGGLGLALILVGMISSVLFSTVFEKLKRYRLQLFIHIVAAIPWCAGFVICLLLVEEFIVVAAMILIFWSLYSPTIGFIVEITAEIVYPINANIAIAFSLLIGNIFGNSATQLASWLVDHHNDKVILWMIVGLVAIQVFILIGVKVEKRRSNADVMENPIKSINV